LKLFIHIGAHKTGTTSIQMAMEDSGQALAAAGFIYPRCCWYHHAQHRLAFALKTMRDPAAGDTPEFASELADLQRALAEAKAGRALISSEEFFALKDDAVARLAGGLKQYEVAIIAFVRRPDELFLSSYNQNAKQPGNRFFKPLHQHLANPAAVTADIDYLEHIGTWAAHFGKDNIHLAVYEEGDVTDTICAILAIDASRLNRPAVAANASVSGKTLELMRQLKSLGASAEIQKAVLPQAAALFPPGAGGARMPAEFRLEILKRYAAQNQALFAMMGGRENPYDPARIGLAEEGPPEQLSKRDLAELIVRLARNGQA
jgi:hypothetical protein